ncbi:enolase-phosphatase E1 [Salpingoeca rosetta]|uniref:Enolase-phosphatase E1 n=1 Tax=Salpingoeca rosetta (strain ATCC 50818 / BSB-021) TaxID=946362 RepID=F2UJ44_SALR5|nr:enolase-phosphatase E1 [Salpingoeca rosetta]EGD76992.1 enolase-phosphatase E1 [Salpingoeca rosetta]|eukprot:XP_004990832.1 enolase-phosphatase E1 [Salpingoeca rosetta]
MDNDRKATALKQLQGHIWKDAYESGAVKGHVYDDVRPAMERWVADGIQVRIYSSGSVAAQKLLFKHSENGDMTKLLSGHYDTRIGGKMEAASYRRIAEEAMTKPNSILFLSDRIEECEAARAAGLMVVVSIRPGNADIPSDRLNAFESITSFDQLVLTPVDGEPTTKTAKTAADDHGSTADAGAKGSSDTA